MTHIVLLLTLVSSVAHAGVWDWCARRLARRSPTPLYVAEKIPASGAEDGDLQHEFLRSYAVEGEGVLPIAADAWQDAGFDTIADSFRRLTVDDHKRFADWNRSNWVRFWRRAGAQIFFHIGPRQALIPWVVGDEQLVEAQSDALVQMRAPHFALSSKKNLELLDATFRQLRHVHSLAIAGRPAIEIFQELNRRGLHAREGGGHDVWDAYGIRDGNVPWPVDEYDEMDDPFLAEPSVNARHFLLRLVSGEFPNLRYVELWDEDGFPSRVDRWSVEALRRELAQSGNGEG